MSGRGMNLSGINKSEIYQAVAQALSEQSSGGGGGGGFVAPSFIVAGTANYTVPVGYNARVTFQSIGTGQGAINGMAVIRTAGKTASLMRANSSPKNVTATGGGTYHMAAMSYSANSSYTAWGDVFANSTIDTSDCLSTSHNVKAGTTITTSGGCVYCIELYLI